MGSKLTKYDLDHVTDYIEFEAFCNNLMSMNGYKRIEPMGGHKDRGRDAIDVDKSTGKVTIFTYSVREDWEEKLDEDLEKIQRYKHSCETVVFLTSSTPTSSEKDNKKKEVKKKYGWELEIYDLERIATMVDTCKDDKLRSLHPDIFFISSRVLKLQPSGNALNRIEYAEYLLALHDEWRERYTPLLAEHREVDVFVVPTETRPSRMREIAVVEIPKPRRVSVLLGESGAGKTTALWRIVVEAGHTLKEGTSEQLPILITLRGWSFRRTCRDLVQDQFDLLEVSHEAVEQELLKGHCLILLDGLNEVRESLQTEAYQDLQRFLSKYWKNSFLLGCRVSDYDARMLDSETTKLLPRLFEIRRMGRKQIVDYVYKHFKTAKQLADNLISQLGVNNDDVWNEQTSLVHLVRIPLYLQLSIDVYERTEQLPTSQGKLVKVLVDRILERERVRWAATIDTFAKERLLSSFAYEAVNQGYWLELPERLARNILQSKLNDLKTESLIGKDVTVGALWQEILSNNLLTSTNPPSVEWLHQIICDYFIGSEIGQIWTVGSQAERALAGRRLSRHVWGLPCEVALSILDSKKGAEFLDDLLAIDDELARRAFESLGTQDQQAVVEILISQIVNQGEPETERLERLAVTLPTLITIQTLINHFKSCSVDMEAAIARAISSFMVDHGVYVVAHKSGFDVDQDIGARRYALVAAAEKRARTQLIGWTNNRNEFVSFYAAKGLWASDKGMARDVLVRLYGSKNPKVRQLVKNLMEECGIE